MTDGKLEFDFLEQTLFLLPQRAIYWKQKNTLIVSDVHLGKGGHFRKAGIAIPRELAQDDLAVLSDLIRLYQPEKLIFLGDLFHSTMNTDWEWFVLWREQFRQLEIILITGNHDIIPGHNFESLGIRLYLQFYLAPFLMQHLPCNDADLLNINGYVLCGHLHPGIHLKGKGRQSITLPCFAFGNKQAILPSFGKFTGRMAIQQPQNYQIFAALKDKVISIGENH